MKSFEWWVSIGFWIFPCCLWGVSLALNTPKSSKYYIQEPCSALGLLELRPDKARRRMSRPMSLILTYFLYVQQIGDPPHYHFATAERIWCTSIKSYLEKHIVLRECAFHPNAFYRWKAHCAEQIHAKGAAVLIDRSVFCPGEASSLGGITVMWDSLRGDDDTQLKLVLFELTPPMRFANLTATLSRYMFCQCNHQMR